MCISRSVFDVQNEEKDADVRAMTVPLLKSLFAPSRRVNVTVPEVVGFQVMVEGWPAVSI